MTRTCDVESATARERSSWSLSSDRQETLLAAPTTIATRFHSVDGLQIRYAQSDRRDKQAVLLSPWPESLFAFEQMWEPLAEHAQLDQRLVDA